jgi:peptide/nickel transport system permease protein
VVGSWFVRRLAVALAILFVALTINFIIPRVMPGNPIQMLVSQVKLSSEVRQALIQRFGLDQPLWQQFVKYLMNSFRGDFGVSFSYYPRSVMYVVTEVLPRSLLILSVSWILQFLIGCFLGITAAWKVGAKTDSMLQTISLAVWSTPLFWMAMIFLYIFAFQLGWFPLSGYQTAGATYSNMLESVADVAKHAILPIMALTVNWYASYQLIMRNTMVTVLNEPYILTAVAKGLSERSVKYKHAARNALLPVITYSGLSFFAIAVGHLIFVETVFSYPGIGKLLFDSVCSRDYPVLQGCFLMFSVLIIATNLFVDILYTRLDPRVRY